MLYVLYGDMTMYNKRYNTRHEVVYRINDWFDFRYKPEWLNNGFAKRMIKEVDRSEHIIDDIIKSPYRGHISPKQLSGGVKSLITLDNDGIGEEFYENPLIVYGTNMGDNCTNGLIELANKKDIWININHFLQFEDNKSIRAVIVNNNTKVSNTTELNNAIIDTKSEWHIYANKLYNIEQCL